ncbi:MAG: 50S ribosomal protein L28 [Acidobacteriota bacterium]
MSKRCELCNKGTVFGHSISHAQSATNRSGQTNLQRVRAYIDGAVRRAWACSRCMRNGNAHKPPIRSWSPRAEVKTS